MAPAVLLLVSPVLASCTVNFGEQTDKVYNVAAGVSDRSGEVDVLNALVVSSETGSGTVVATLVNNDQTQADSLKGISGAGADSSLTVTPGGPTDIAANGLLNLATDGSNFISGSKVEPGRDVRVTFTFERAKAVTMTIPVVGDTPDYAGVTLPSSSASSSASPSAGSSAGSSAIPSATSSATPPSGGDASSASASATPNP